MINYTIKIRRWIKKIVTIVKKRHAFKSDFQIFHFILFFYDYKYLNRTATGEKKGPMALSFPRAPFTLPEYKTARMRPHARSFVTSKFFFWFLYKVPFIISSSQLFSVLFSSLLFYFLP